MIIIVDLDVPVVDFENGFLTRFREKYPGMPYVPIEERNSFYARQQYEQLYRKSGLDDWFKEKDPIKSIIGSPGFFQGLLVVPGSIEALVEMSKEHEVFLCTQALGLYDNSLLEKYNWVNNHFDESWVKRMILSRDRTLLRADVLLMIIPI